MLVEHILVYSIPVAVFAVTAIGAFFLGKNKSRAGFIALAILWAGFTGAMFFGMGQAKGYDGFAYMFAVIGISAPVGAGLLIGGPVGWLKKDKTTHA